MAIIIRDMDMPTQCSQCLFGFRIDNARTACSRNPMESPVEDGDERPKHCPLKEVNNEINMKNNVEYCECEWCGRLVICREIDGRMLCGRCFEEYKNETK